MLFPRVTDAHPILLSGAAARRSLCFDHHLDFKKKKARCSGTCLLIPAFGKQKQAHLYEFKDSLVYIVGFRTAKATKCHLASKNQTKKKTKNSS